MRDEKRIPEILKELEYLWVRYPDLRLGQLIVNVVEGVKVRLYYIEDVVEGVRLYYIEDEDLV